MSRFDPFSKSSIEIVDEILPELNHKIQNTVPAPCS